MDTILADVSGGTGLVQLAMQVFVVGLCLALVFALGRWAITKFALPAIVMTCWVGLFLVVGCIVVINFLLGLVGHSMFKYW
jgi:hypothetical protein